MSETTLLDHTDIKVLRILQKDASQSIADIAREAGMSQTPCWRRIKRLKESGVIKQVAALVDRESVGLGFLAYSFVKLNLPSRENMETFDRLVNVWPEVVTCERITGAVDYLIKVVTTDIKDYDNFLRLKLLNNELVSDVQSRIVVSTIKETVALPLRE
ncbi:Lrp/AsnC family transcriptional regulator [Polycladidibacter hongkongensis]|uniref:Lrp/AsnC family transcriptional regulator n=1 Tax=Polycladidibacter hongkongensis TaxID=1647556 RepID=UPI0008339D20|nr:Lrp/AsnC family transcriptional regulator [Pseudovibrio hongkongensis]